MRNTVLILGVIAGLWGMLIGFFGYGYTQFIEWFGEIPDVAEQVDHVTRTQIISLVGPILALVGGGLAHARPVWSGPILLVSGVPGQNYVRPKCSVPFALPVWLKNQLPNHDG